MSVLDFRLREDHAQLRKIPLVGGIPETPQQRPLPFFVEVS
jgi:hypothetical protein